MTTPVEVDEHICLSSGKCVADAPDSFAFDDDEIAQAIDGGEPLDGSWLIKITQGCPAGAITVFEGDEPVGMG